MTKGTRLCAVVLSSWLALVAAGCSSSPYKTERYSVNGAHVKITYKKDSAVGLLGLNYQGQAPIYKDLSMQIDCIGFGYRLSSSNSQKLTGWVDINGGSKFLTDDEVKDVIERYGRKSKVF